MCGWRPWLLTMIVLLLMLRDRPRHGAWASIYLFKDEIGKLSYQLNFDLITTMEFEEGEKRQED